MTPADATLTEEMRRAAHTRPDSQVVYQGAGGSLVTSVAQLHARALRVAYGLAGLGVRPGDTVAVQVPNWAEGAVAHAAGWLAGTVVLPIVPIYGPREVGFILRQSAAPDRKS